MSRPADVSWVLGPVPALDEVTGLIRRCLAQDGGLPLATGAGFVRSRWQSEGSTGLQARTPDGRLIAAGTLRPGAGGGSVRGAGGGSVLGGLVDPGHRGAGLGARLLDITLAEAARRAGPITVETESWTPAAAGLFESRGLRQTFAEDVLRFDLAAAVPDAALPPGTALEGWSGASAGRFFRVYEAAFRERPGFPGWTAEQWIDDVTDDFRPGWSMLATVPSSHDADAALGNAGLNNAGLDNVGRDDAGFLIAADDWIVQVGVVPAARGRGLAAALIAEALRRMRADAVTEAWLTVNVNNPAARLYRRLGFAPRGRRARYAPA